MKKIYVLSFLGGLFLGLVGLWFGAISNVLGGFYNNLTRGFLGDLGDVMTAVIYFALLFLAWLSFSFLFKRVVHLDEKKHRTLLFVGLLGISVIIIMSILFFLYADFGFSV